jgi:hypothetical protein
MGHKAVRWVLEHSEARGSARLVLLVLAEHANGDSPAWPSVATIAQEANITERGVQLALHELERLGEVKVDPGGGRKRCNGYHLPKTPNSVRPSTSETPNSVRPSEVETPKSVPETPKSVRRNPEQISPEPSTEPSTNQQPTPPTPPADTIRQVWETYLDACQLVGLSVNARLTPKRQDKIRARLKTNPLADVLDAAQGWTRDPWPDRRNHCDAKVIFRDDEQVEKFRDLWRNGPPRVLGKQTAKALDISRQMQEMGPPPKGNSNGLGAVAGHRGGTQYQLPPSDHRA